MDGLRSTPISKPLRFPSNKGFSVTIIEYNVLGVYLNESIYYTPVVSDILTFGSNHEIIIDVHFVVNCGEF